MIRTCGEIRRIYQELDDSMWASASPKWSSQNYLREAPCGRHDWPGGVCGQGFEVRVMSLRETAA